MGRFVDVPRLELDSGIVVVALLVGLPGHVRLLLRLVELVGLAAVVARGRVVVEQPFGVALES